MGQESHNEKVRCAMRVPVIRGAGEGEKRSFFGGGLHTWKLRTEETGGAFFMFEDAMGRAKTTPWHLHPNADETLYVLEGEIVINIGGRECRVGAGAMTFTPKGVPHAFMVLSETARLLTMQSPGDGEAFYRGASDPTTESTSGLVDMARIQASAKANPRGIEVLGPPPFGDVELAG